MKKKSLLREVKQLQKIAGLLKENELDLTDNPLIPKKIKRGTEVLFGFEGESRGVSQYGTVEDIAANYDEAVRKGGDLSNWDELFNSEEAAEDYGYDSFEDWITDYVFKHKNSGWYEIRNEHGEYQGWFPEEYVQLDEV